MGAKTWMLVYSEGSPLVSLSAQPKLDHEATVGLANSLFPGEKLQLIGESDLSYTCPPDDEIFIGKFAGLAVVAAKEFGIDYPSNLPERFLKESLGANVYLHAMHSVVDWFAYGHWVDGKLVRSLSLSPDSGILEDIGKRYPFEEPFWLGNHSAVDPEEEEDAYPFPFHPLELAEATLRALFGYQLEGFVDNTLLEPESISLLRFKRLRPWWKFWR